MSEETHFDIDEELIFFRRFPAEKQDQVRALVNYATLMGLTGKDLVSIGGKLDRLKAAQEKKARTVIVEELLKHCILFPKDKNEHNPSRFKYKDASGRIWVFTDVHYYHAKVTSDSGTTKRFNLDTYDLGGGRSKWYIKQALMNLHDGTVLLNF